MLQLLLGRDWTANRERLPNGLKPLIDKIKECGMKPGIWLSLLGADPSTDVAKEHPEWIILDRDGVPVRAQWNLPAFDLVGGYYQTSTENSITVNYFDESYTFDVGIDRFNVGQIIYTKAGNALCKAIIAEKIEGFFKEKCISILKESI